MCCGDHFKKLSVLGVTADIDLEYTRDSFEKLSGVEVFLWLPTRDHAAPSPTQLITGIRTIEALVQAKTKVYVHCEFGHGRSPSLVIAYFIMGGMSFHKAHAYVKKRRPEVHLLPAQVRGLEIFAEYIKRGETV